MLNIDVFCYNINAHKQPSIGVLQKMCSAITQQIYGRSPVQKYDFNGPYYIVRPSTTSCDHPRPAIISPSPSTNSHNFIPTIHEHPEAAII